MVMLDGVWQMVEALVVGVVSIPHLPIQVDDATNVESHRFIHFPLVQLYFTILLLLFYHKTKRNTTCIGFN